MLNGQPVSVPTIVAPTGQVSIGGLAHDVADLGIETFQRRSTVFTFWNLVILFWNPVILPAVLLAASAPMPCFLFSVWRTGPAPESAPGTAAL